MLEFGERETIARWRLRRIRARDAFGESVSADDEAMQRDALLAVLWTLVDRSQISADELPAQLVDAAVSVALATVEERPTDRVTALLAAGEVLASDQQFARLHQLAPLLRSLRDDLRQQRPFLAVAIDGLHHHLQGRQRQALTLISRTIGLDGRVSRPLARRSLESLVDLRLAAAVRAWLATGGTEALRDARLDALRSSNAPALELASFFLTYAASVAEASLSGVLARSGAWPDVEAANSYLVRRGMPTLLPPQTSAINQGVLYPGSAVVAMPTSTGKTFLAELKLVAALAGSPNRRAIYLAPYRLLSRQVESDLREGLRYADLSVRDMGSVFDISIEETALTEEVPDVAIMTPERLDALTRLALTDRRGSDEVREFLDSVCLVVFDEVHLVGRPGRGPRLELFLARWRRRYPHVPLLALSGVVEGIDRLGEWLECSSITGGGVLLGPWSFFGARMGRLYSASMASEVKLRRFDADSEQSTTLLHWF